jgi:flavin-dependent dehydrogenase
MSRNAPRGHETGPARPEEQLRDTRVTAQIVVDADGERRTVYRARGREFGSLTTLKAALGVVA